MIEPLLPEESIFAQALEIVSAEERAAFLECACSNNQALRAEVEALLRAHEQSGDLLDLPENLPVTTDLPSREGSGTVIGPYKLLEQIGEGGMGTVWMAEQTEPIKRRVAIKVVKEGMDSKPVLARFEAERQALALMEHPNIAKVLEAGQTPSGSPYFVMELVKGKPITTYCNEKRLGVRERLDLFGDICQAVQHAHQKGIIHRDLKPSNVLVAPYDGKPVVKVIDFGVAKATGQRLTDKTLFTGFGALVGTPEYMSPEQAEVNNQDIDTRSDLYSLGVMLYELLTGSTPLTRKRVKETGLLEVLRAIREEEPPRPSTRLLESKDTLPSISAQRQSEPAKLTKLVRGELDWIVMKALDKDRNRRYETANGFAADVQRYLQDEPVQASPPSAVYRLRKFVRRHKALVLGATLVVLALVAGVIGTTVGMIRAELWAKAEAEQRKQVERERDDKETARALAASKTEEALKSAVEERRAKQDAVKAAAAEKAAKEAAQKSLKQVEKSNVILASIFQALNLHREEKDGIPVGAQLAEQLAKAAELLKEETVGDVERVARLQVLLGQTMTSLGYAEQAIPVLTKALRTFEKLPGSTPADTLTIMNDLAEAYNKAGKLAQAVQLHREILEKRTTLLGPDDPDTISSLNNLALAYHEAGQFDLALPLYEDALAKTKAKWGADDHRTLTCLNNLATLYMDTGKRELGLSLYQEVLEKTKATRGADHLETLGSMNNLALAYLEAGKLDLALPLALEAVSQCKAKLGADHPNTLVSMSNLASAYADAGKFDLALSLHLETLERRKRKLGADHPDTLYSINNLAGVYMELDRPELALPLYRDGLERAKQSLGPDHPKTYLLMDNLAVAYRQTGQFDLALKLHRERLERSKAKRGEDHPDTLRSMASLAHTYAQSSKFDLALPLYRETVDKLRAKLGDDHPDTLNALRGLAEAYYRAGRPDLAGPLYFETLQKRKAKLGADHPDTLASMAELATVLAAVGNVDQAVPLYQEALAKMRATRPDHIHTITCMNNLGDAYRMSKDYDKAVPLYEETLKKCKATLGADHQLTLTAMNNLGLTYHDLGKLDLALPLFVEALDKAKRKLGEKNPYTLTILNNLALTYRSKGQYDLAIPLYLETLKGRQATLGADHPDTLWSMHNLAGAYMAMSKFADAEPLLVGWLEKQRKPPADVFLVAINLNRLGECRLALKKYAEAETSLRDGLAIYEEKKSKLLRRYDTESLLGAALTAQKKFDEAEPFLVGSAKVLLRNVARVDAENKARTMAAVDRVIEFYTDRGNAEEAANWRKQRDEAFPPKKEP